MAKKPWRKFSVGNPSENPRCPETDCDPFKEVWHVTHILNALTIIGQGTIRPQLVYDESILNTRRTLVNWVSPNHWFPGYRYGNVAFDFDWYQLIKGKWYYWVEWMDYSPNACRILVTDMDYDDDPHLSPYDPTLGDGPWWWDEEEGIHYRNGTICLEFMLEFELFVADSTSINFVKHHDDLCCVDRSCCPDLGRDKEDAAACLLAGIIAEDLDVTEISLDKHQLRAAWSYLRDDCPTAGYEGDVGRSDAAAPSLACGAAYAYYRHRKKDFRNLANLFYSQAALQASLLALAEKKFPNLSRRSRSTES
jgi:hypothetical protein